jgi:putative phage-type endonuclease
VDFASEAFGEAEGGSVNARADWLAARRTGIGGSDAAVIFDASPFCTALELYHDKRGELPVEDTEPAHLKWGRLLEPVVRQEYAERTGRIVQQIDALVVHPKYPWMIGNMDGHVVDGKRVYEGKTARTAEGWGEQGTDKVPEHILFQVQHYLCVTAYEVADVAVLIGGSDFRMYEIPADREFQELMIEGEREFWQSVVSGQPPEPQFERQSARDMLRKLFPGTNGQTLHANESLAHWRAVYEDAAERAKLYTTTADMAKAHMLNAMGEAAQLAFPDGKCLRRKVLTRKGYTVNTTQYVDARFTNLKEE